jgi:putative SOS response-associated peptidase YedK
MCGRVVTSSASDAIAEFFDASLAIPAEYEPDYNRAPTEPIRAVITRRSSGGSGWGPRIHVAGSRSEAEAGARHHEHRRELRRFRWGLVPSSAKAIGDGPLMINARAETVTSKGIFARLLPYKRCVVPVDGFYEWQRTGDPKHKQPYLAYPPDGGLFAMAGLWDTWRDGEVVVPSLTIVTTAANGTMSPLHDRMPAILPPEAWARWLDPELQDPDELAGLLVPADDGVLALRPVSTLVNSVRNKGPEVLEPPKDEQSPLTEVQGTLDLR